MSTEAQRAKMEKAIEETAGDEHLEAQGSSPTVVPINESVEVLKPERERRTWTCAEEELDLCEAAEEALEAARVVWNQANARHNGRVQTAINRTRKKVDDMPEVNIARGEKFFLVGRKGDKWEEVFENEVQRG